MQRLSLGLLIGAAAIFILLSEGAAWLHYGLTAIFLFGALIVFVLSRRPTA